MEEINEEELPLYINKNEGILIHQIMTDISEEANKQIESSRTYVNIDPIFWGERKDNAISLLKKLKNLGINIKP
jgi:hypothetical protein